MNDFIGWEVVLERLHNGVSKQERVRVMFLDDELTIVQAIEEAKQRIAKLTEDGDPSAWLAIAVYPVREP